MALISKLQKRYAHAERERGAVLILTALVMMLLLFIAAFATDLGAWYRQGQEQQRAADVSALNGVQAYDRAVKDYFEGLPGDITRWDQVTLQQAQAAEAAGLQAAAETIIGLLETSGLSFSDAGDPLPASDPRDPNLVSTWTVVADDGTTVVITRSLVETGVDASGNILYSRSIDVQLTAPGEQYFSNILRDAPEIDRSASSLLSNCGAVCSTPIELFAPFRGFDASGDGDGWAPLLRGGQNGDEIWAINHHSNNKKPTDTQTFSIGSIVCMDRNTEAACNFPSPYPYPAGATHSWFDGQAVPLATYPPDGTIPLTGIRTHNKATDYIDNTRDHLYFTAKRQSTEQTGLFCFDMAARDWCTTQFLPLWAQDGTEKQVFSWQPNAVGPLMYNDKLYIMSQHGELACVNPGVMTSCGTVTLPVATHDDIPDHDAQGRINNLELVGSKLLMTFALKNDSTAFVCWDLAIGANGASCANWGNTAKISNAAGTSNRRFTFLKMTQAANPIANNQPAGIATDICVVNSETGGHDCAAIANGVITTSIPGSFGSKLNTEFETGWIGDSFLINQDGPGGQVRTVFGGGLSNKTFCWDWLTNDSCGTVDHGATEVESYAFAQISDDCVIGLGDGSVFFTLNVDTLDTCTGSSVETDVTPCDCADGSTRYGILDLPQALKDDLETASATITGTDGKVETGNLLDLPLDLATFNGDPGPLKLEIEVVSKVVAGQVVWTQDYFFDLELVVQSTLTS